MAARPEAANRRLRAELVDRILRIAQSHGWTQAEAARRAGMTAPRMSDLARGLTGRFSLDALVAMLERMGARVALQVDEPG